MCVSRLKISTTMKSQMHLAETWRHLNLFDFNMQWMTAAILAACHHTASLTSSISSFIQQIVRQLHSCFVTRPLHLPVCHQATSCEGLSPDLITPQFVIRPPHMLNCHQTSEQLVIRPHHMLDSQQFALGQLCPPGCHETSSAQLDAMLGSSHKHPHA